MLNQQTLFRLYMCVYKTLSEKIIILGNTIHEFCTLVHFKRLGSRHIHKEIKLQKAMNGMDRVLCKTDQILIRRHTYTFNTFSDVYFEAFSKSAYVPLWYSQFQEYFERGWLPFM